MKYAVEGGSGAIIYIPSFVKIVSAIQKSHTQVYFHFFKKRKVD
jgi:hypothetical protein